MKDKLSLVSYAVNGSGLGHLVRMVALNRWMRRYACFAGVRTQHWFLTTSEADTLLFQEGFAGFKLPSKSVVEEAGIQKPAYLALAKQWICHSLSLLRPDLLLVDTFPNGSFGELLNALDLVEKKALVLRPVKEEVARRPAFKAMVGLYDRVLVPEHEEGLEGLPALLEIAPERVAFTGPVMRTEAFERLPREDARRRLGVDEDAFCLLVTGGGGGDASVERLFARAVELCVSRPRIHLLLAAGPLYRGRAWRGPRTTWFSEADLAEHLHGVDGALCAAGFNMVHELLHARVPTALAPQEKIADDQPARVDALVRAGAVLRADLEDPASLAMALDALLDPKQSLALAGAGLRAVPRNHARDAAREALSLVLPEAALRRAVEVVDDALLEEARRLGARLEDLVDLACALSPRAERAALDLEPARQVARACFEVGAPLQAASRIASSLGKKMRGRRPPSAQAMASATAALLVHPTTEGQWPALHVLLQALVGEREKEPEELARDLVALLDRGLSAGRDVFSMARFVVEASAELGEEVTTNGPVFLRAAGKGGLP